MRIIFILGTNGLTSVCIVQFIFALNCICETQQPLDPVDKILRDPIHWGKVKADLSWPQHPLLAVWPQSVPFLPENDELKNGYIVFIEHSLGYRNQQQQVRSYQSIIFNYLKSVNDKVTAVHRNNVCQFRTLRKKGLIMVRQLKKEHEHSMCVFLMVLTQSRGKASVC